MMAVEKKSVYEPAQAGLLFPRYPEFRDATQEREYRKQRLAAACRLFADLGYEYGFAGHITVRDPEEPTLYWTNPFAVEFGAVKVSNLLLVDHSGRVVEGRHAVNRAGFVLHAAIHEANPGILASCHCHTINGMAWAALGRRLDPITQTACGFYGDGQILITEEAGAVVVEREAGHSVAAAFAGNAKIAIHQNHGLFSAGRESVEEAVWWLVAAERACQIQLKAEASGLPLQFIEPDKAEHSAKHLATSFMAWLHAQPMFDRVFRTHPDVIE